jgi:adenosylcobinamide-GDP ribazoletransferase
MDGFMDTADAIGSHRSREEKLEIMKDSHAGAFAVLWCAAYLLLSFGVYFALCEKTALWLVGIAFILSRALCAVSALTLPPARSGGILDAFTEHAKNRVAVFVMILVSAICAAGMALLDPRLGLCCIAAAVIAFFAYRGLALKLFGGATGDTSGFFIQVCELCLLYGALIGASL